MGLDQRAGLPRRGDARLRSDADPGLVSIYDLKPTVERSRPRGAPAGHGEAVGDVLPRLERLGERLDAAHETRERAALMLVGVIILFALLGLLARSPLLARAALLAAPIAPRRRRSRSAPWR